MTIEIARLFTNRLQALLAGAALALMPSMYNIGGEGLLDGPQLFFILLSILAFLYGLLRGRPNAFILSGIAIGLGTMTKTPFGLLVIPVFIAYAAATGRLAALLKWQWVVAAGFWLLIVLPWYLYM